MGPIRNILCPVDLSDISRAALEYAVGLARALEARLQALQVLELVEPGRDNELRRRCLDEFERFVQPLRMGVPVETVLTEGNAAGEILRAAEASRADLIVMGTHGRSGFERFVLGSVTERVLRQARCPVLAVPPGGGRKGGYAAFRTIVCAVDFAPASLRGIEYARRLAAAGGRLELVHAVEGPFGVGDAPMPPEIDALRRSLEQEALGRLRRFTASSQRPDIVLHASVTTGKPYAHILRQARETSADLIVVGLHSHATSDLALLGSTARRVLHDAPCPVLTVSER